MRQLFLYSSLLILALLLATPSSLLAEKPNIIFILADDSGFSALGCYGSEIETPNLDGLAKNGLMFTQFYNTGRCWPTRAALMSGYYPHMVHRDNADDLACLIRRRDASKRWVSPLACARRVSLQAPRVGAQADTVRGTKPRPSRTLQNGYMCHFTVAVSVRGSPGMLYRSALPCAAMK